MLERKLTETREAAALAALLVLQERVNDVVERAVGDAEVFA
jgi:hypothetical protein